MPLIYIVYRQSIDDGNDFKMIKAFKTEKKAMDFIYHQLTLNVTYKNYDYHKEKFLESFPHCKPISAYKFKKLELEQLLEKTSDETIKFRLERINQSIKFLEENPNYHAEIEKEFLNVHGLKPNVPDYLNDLFEIDTLELVED